MGFRHHGRFLAAVLADAGSVRQLRKRRRRRHAGCPGGGPGAGPHRPLPGRCPPVLRPHRRKRPPAALGLSAEGADGACEGVRRIRPQVGGRRRHLPPQRRQPLRHGQALPQRRPLHHAQGLRETLRRAPCRSDNQGRQGPAVPRPGPHGERFQLLHGVLPPQDGGRLLSGQTAALPGPHRALPDRRNQRPVQAVERGRPVGGGGGLDGFQHTGPQRPEHPIRSAGRLLSAAGERCRPWRRLVCGQRGRSRQPRRGNRPSGGRGPAAPGRGNHSCHAERSEESVRLRRPHRDDFLCAQRIALPVFGLRRPPGGFQ